MKRAWTDLRQGAARAGKDAAAPHQGKLAATARVREDMAAAAGQGLSDTWNGVTAGANAAIKGDVAALRHAGQATGRTYDAAVDAGARAVGRSHGPRAAAAVRRDLQAVAAPVRTLANFQFGVAQGVARSAVSLVKGTGDLAVGATRMASDPAYARAQLRAGGQIATGLGHAAQGAAHDPAGAAHAAGQAIARSWRGLTRDERAAAQQGRLAEWSGDRVGETGAELAQWLVPWTKAAKARKAAAELAKLGKLARAEQGAAQIAKGARTVAAKPADPFAWVRSINGPPGAPKSRVNCVQSAFNVDRRFATGVETGATGHNPHVGASLRNLGDAGRIFGAKFTPMSRPQIEAALLHRGEGARGIVMGLGKPGGDGHLWNAIVHDGRVRFLDGQSGGGGAANFTRHAKTALAITGHSGDGVVGPGLPPSLQKLVTPARRRGPAELLGPASPRQAGQGRQARRAAAEAITQVGGTADAADRALVVHGLARSVAAPTLQALGRKGLTVHVVRGSIVEHYPALKGVRLPGSRSTYASVRESYNVDTRELVVATGKATHNAKRVRELPAGSNHSMLQEVGRALDHLSPGASAEKPLSQQAAFRFALRRDGGRGSWLERSFAGVPPEEVFAQLYPIFVHQSGELKRNAPYCYALLHNVVQHHGIPIKGADAFRPLRGPIPGLKALSAAAASPAPAAAAATSGVMGQGRQARIAAAHAMTGLGGTATEADRTVVINEMAKVLPQTTMASLRKAGVHVVVARLGDPELRDPKMLYGQILGQYFPDTKRLVVGTEAAPRSGVAAARRVPKRPQNVLLHEIGHALDYNSPGATRQRPLSSQAAFLIALRRDRKAGVRFGVEHGEKNEREILAAKFATFAANPDQVRRESPHVYAFLHNMVQHHNKPITPLTAFRPVPRPTR